MAAQAVPNYTGSAASTGQRSRPKFDTDTGPEGRLNLMRRQVEGRLAGLRTYRYSWWVHWRELADYLLPRRYKWLITPNQADRGSPINQHIIDSTGSLAALKCAAGIMFGASSPTQRWFKLKIGNIDSTQTSPISLWLKAVEDLLYMIFHESNFYTSLAVWYLDLVVFGTAVLIIYEDFENVIHCFNPCLGEFYLENSDKFEIDTMYREFVLTVSQMEQKFGFAQMSPSFQRLFETGGAMLTKEGIIGHCIEPNGDGRKFGVPSQFRYREVYWERTQPSNMNLTIRGFYEKPHICVRWDLVSNDAYGRSPGMDALPDVKQLQQESKRKAQAIDKQVNPPLVADIQLKNQPASLLPGGITYVSGMTTGKVGFAPVYTVTPNLQQMMEDLNEVRSRISRIFFNDLFQTISQYETRSNVTAVEIDARKAESLVMLGPVFQRIFKGLNEAVERTFAVASRAGILPPAPREIQGRAINVQFISILAKAQEAVQAGGIERLMSFAGNLAGVDPAVMDNIDVDYALDKYSALLNNDPRIIRSPAQLAQIRQQRQQQQAQQQQAEMAEKMAQGAKTLSEADVGGGRNALQAVTGAQQ